MSRKEDGRLVLYYVGGIHASESGTLNGNRNLSCRKGTAGWTKKPKRGVDE